MSDDLMGLALTALGVAAAGIVAAGWGGATELKSVLAEHRAARAEAEAYERMREEAELIDAIGDDLMVLEMELAEPPAPTRRRHNLHCPTCGRFAARVLPGVDNVVNCKVHDIQVRWKDIPVDWVHDFFVQGMPIITETVHIEEEVFLAPVTEPIAIIVPDDLSSLAELGARI